MDIGILGCGTIGSALALGLRNDPTVNRIVVNTRTSHKALPWPDIIVAKSNVELASVSDVIILCVKPSQMEGVLREIASELRSDTLVISVAAGVSTAAINQWLGASACTVRAMPNMPCRIAAGVTALCKGDSAKDEHLDRASRLFSCFGHVALVEERLMDAVTALSGCGPAYVYLIIEALTEAGVSLGLSRTVALELAAHTLRGSASMVLESGAHPATLRDEVTTPAGCTIDGLLALEDGRLRSTLVRGVAAAAARSAQLCSKPA